MESLPDIEAMSSAERRLEIARLIEATAAMPGISVRLAKLMRREWPEVINELIRAEKRHDVMCDLAGAVRENQLHEQDHSDEALGFIEKARAWYSRWGKNEILAATALTNIIVLLNQARDSLQPTATPALPSAGSDSEKPSGDGGLFAPATT